MIGLVVVIVAFWVQISRIAENYAVIEEMLAEVRANSRARRTNLPVEESEPAMRAVLQRVTRASVTVDGK